MALLASVWEAGKTYVSKAAKELGSEFKHDVAGYEIKPVDVITTYKTLHQIQTPFVLSSEQKKDAYVAFKKNAGKSRKGNIYDSRFASHVGLDNEIADAYRTKSARQVSQDFAKNGVHVSDSTIRRLARKFLGDNVYTKISSERKMKTMGKHVMHVDSQLEMPDYKNTDWAEAAEYMINFGVALAAPAYDAFFNSKLWSHIKNKALEITTPCTEELKKEFGPVITEYVKGLKMEFAETGSNEDTMSSKALPNSHDPTQSLLELAYRSQLPRNNGNTKVGYASSGVPVLAPSSYLPRWAREWTRNLGARLYMMLRRNGNNGHYDLEPFNEVQKTELATPFFDDAIVETQPIEIEIKSKYPAPQEAASDNGNRISASDLLRLAYEAILPRNNGNGFRYLGDDYFAAISPSLVAENNNDMHRSAKNLNELEGKLVTIRVLQNQMDNDNSQSTDLPLEEVNPSNGNGHKRSFLSYFPRLLSRKKTAFILHGYEPEKEAHDVCAHMNITEESILGDKGNGTDSHKDSAAENGEFSGSLTPESEKGTFVSERHK